jgi:hypothetical protein
MHLKHTQRGKASRHDPIRPPKPPQLPILEQKGGATALRQRSDNPPKRPPHLPLLDLLDGRQSLYPVRCAGSSRHRTSNGPIIGTGAAHELNLAGAVVSSLVAQVLWHTLYHAAGHRAGTAREGPYPSEDARS